MNYVDRMKNIAKEIYNLKEQQIILKEQEQDIKYKQNIIKSKIILDVYNDKEIKNERHRDAKISILLDTNKEWLKSQTELKEIVKKLNLVITKINLKYDLYNTYKYALKGGEINE